MKNNMYVILRNIKYRGKTNCDAKSELAQRRILYNIRPEWLMNWVDRLVLIDIGHAFCVLSIRFETWQDESTFTPNISKLATALPEKCAHCGVNNGSKLKNRTGQRKVATTTKSRSCIRISGFPIHLLFKRKTSAVCETIVRGKV